MTEGEKRFVDWCIKNRYNKEEYMGIDSPKVSGEVHEELIREKTRVEVIEERQKQIRSKQKLVNHNWD